VASLVQYHRLSNQLREQGLSEDKSPDAPICRWRAEGVILDLMPTNPPILGFANEFLYALPGHLPSDRASQERLPVVMGRIRSIAKQFFSISTKNSDLV
jgi:hypothetical protein